MKKITSIISDHSPISDDGRKVIIGDRLYVSNEYSFMVVPIGMLPADYDCQTAETHKVAKLLLQQNFAEAQPRSLNGMEFKKAILSITPEYINCPLCCGDMLNEGSEIGEYNVFDIDGQFFNPETLTVINNLIYLTDATIIELKLVGSNFIMDFNGIIFGHAGLSSPQRWQTNRLSINNEQISVTLNEIHDGTL